MTTAHDHGEGIDPEHALKYALQHHSGDRTEIVDGGTSPISRWLRRSWRRAAGTVTLFSGPGRLGYAGVDGPHAFGAPVRLPEPFGIEVDTSGL